MPRTITGFLMVALTTAAVLFVLARVPQVGPMVGLTPPNR